MTYDFRLVIFSKSESSILFLEDLKASVAKLS